MRVGAPDARLSAPWADVDETLERMLVSARRFDTAKVRADQVAQAGGAPEES